MGGRGPRRRAATAASVVVAVLACVGAVTAPSASAEPTPSPGVTLPNDDDVSKAQRAAAATAAEVERITVQVAKAEARLETLQAQVAEAVTADERARQQLTDAEALAVQAGADLAAAHRDSDAADRILSGTAAEMYMRGSDLQSLTALLLSPPNVMTDLSMVLDQDALEVRTRVDAARAATSTATAREQELITARQSRQAAQALAVEKRAAAEAAAARAGAEAARLSAEQQELTTRLDVLERTAEDLVAVREAAARFGSGALLGLQSSGEAPRLAREIARQKMPSYRWDSSEFACLVILWQAESGWSWSAANPSSGAYGIPQALPGWKMASAGSDWLTNPETQIDWGLGYIKSVYGSPCKAYDAFLSRSPHWY